MTHKPQNAENKAWNASESRVLFIATTQAHVVAGQSLDSHLQLES